MIEFLQSGVQIPGSNVFAWQNSGMSDINTAGRNAMKNRIQYLKNNNLKSYYWHYLESVECDPPI